MAVHFPTKPSAASGSKSCPDRQPDHDLMPLAFSKKPAGCGIGRNVAPRMQAGSLSDGSRGLSEATPPVCRALKEAHPGRGARQRAYASGTPAGVRPVLEVFRWCRRFAAQPPANVWQASGLRVLALPQVFAGRLVFAPRRVCARRLVFTGETRLIS